MLSTYGEQMTASEQFASSTLPQYDIVPSLAKCGYPASFLLNLYQTVEDCTVEGSIGTFMLLSVDNLAMIVTGYGHTDSERILDSLERAIDDILPSDVVIQRIQRDQFGITGAYRSKQESEHVYNKINNLLRNYNGKSEFGDLHLICSLACVSFPEEVETPEEVMEQAYIRIHNAQSNLSAQPLTLKSNADTKKENLHEMGVARYLGDALREDWLRLAYQPVICSKTGAIKCYEALLRLESEDGNISSAGPLIPIAERMGLIDPIDIKTLDMVIQELRSVEDITIAFNVSNLTTRNNAWLQHFHDMITESPDIAKRMIVEITETAAQMDLGRAAYFVASIQSTGARVALDDFGSGYTSFRQLKSLSVDIVKIDGAFIKDLIDNADNRFFVKTLLDFTRGFGLDAVAEYVENGEVAKMLMELGVEYMQGYYFGHPQLAPEWKESGTVKQS